GLPSVMFDADAGLIARGRETDMQFGLLVGRERGVAPRQHQKVRWLPGADVADHEAAAVVVGLDQAAAGPRVEAESPGATVGELKKTVGAPPLTDLLGERAERVIGSCVDSERNEYS